MGAIKKTITALLLTGAVALPNAVQAQEQAGDKVNQLIIYGDDPCPESSEDEIVVCARKEEDDRFRIPEILRKRADPAKDVAWGERVRSFERVGASGTNSCSATGIGGFTGCAFNFVNQAYAEREEWDDVQWGKLIAAERKKRLASIDADAEAVEKRLREIEAQREAREAAAQAARERLEAQDTSDEQ